VFSGFKEREARFSEFLSSFRSSSGKFPLAWFHASSVGELEMLIPLIEKWAELSTESGERAASIVTIFSESAQGAIRKLETQLSGSGARLLFAGYAPWEGDWKETFEKVNPDFFVTARYEAWPELWMSLARSKIPLVVVGAKARNSLAWAKKACAWMGESLPEILFCTVGEEDVAPLKAEFSESDVAVAGDTRWERVAERAKKGNPRARELVEENRSLPRPWGVLGSAWREDLEIFEKAFEENVLTGTLWIVPHRIEESHLPELEAVLARSKISHRRSKSQSNSNSGLKSQTESGAESKLAAISSVKPDKSESSTKSDDRKIAIDPKLVTHSGIECILVNEMGFLTELYSEADWAYVGGGFGVSVHNTIEPAIYGIPVACGPKRADRFPEIQILSQSEQLRVVWGESDLCSWLKAELNDANRLGSESLLKKQKWLDLGRTRLGASSIILSLVLPWVSGWKLRK
jgi:3-deoxy-D-manno-octulosonic-acid transferase